MSLQWLQYDDPWVHDMLRKYVNPQDLHWSFDLDEAVRNCLYQAQAGDSLFLGSKEDNFLFRLVVRNPFVLEPHVMGDGTKIRRMVRAGEPMVFEKGFHSIMQYTQYAQHVRIFKQLGYKHVATIPSCHLQDGLLYSVAVLCKDRREYDGS